MQHNILQCRYSFEHGSSKQRRVYRKKGLMLTTNWTCRNAYHTELHTLIGTSLSEPHTVISSTMSGFCLAYIYSSEQSCPSCNALCCYAIHDQLGGVAHSFCTAVKRLSESKKHCKLSDVEHSVILWSVFAIGSALAYLLFFQECATPPHIQVRHCM